MANSSNRRTIERETKKPSHKCPLGRTMLHYARIARLVNLTVVAQFSMGIYDRGFGMLSARFLIPSSH